MRRGIFGIALALTCFAPALLAQDQPAPATPAAPAAKQNLTINQRRQLQQQRIGQGVQNGSLTAGEAAKVETQESRLNRETHAMREANGGKLTPADRRRINRQQNALSREIYREKHDADKQASANGPINDRKRMQQERIGQGIKSGSLTPGEAARLERKEAGVNREERAMRQENGGRLTAQDRRTINRQQNQVSRQIHRKKHNAAHQ